MTVEWADEQEKAVLEAAQAATRAEEADLEQRLGWPAGTGAALRIATLATFGGGDATHERALNIDAILRTSPEPLDNGILAERVVRLARHTHLAMEDAVERVLRALAPFVAARESQAAAEALRDAADELERLVNEQHPAALNPDQWLRDRADRIERGGSA